MIKGAVFDMDGTLLDTMSFWDTVGEIYLRSLGFEPKENLNETFKNMSLYQAVCYCRAEYGIALSAQEMMDGVNGLAEGYYRDEAVLKPGAKDFLHRLKAEGVKMCIATATDRYLADAALERCGVREYFSEIFTCTSVGHGKDEPFIYREALRFLQTEKKNTAVFEDALFAARTAEGDGFITVAVYDSHEKHQREIASLSDFYISDYFSLNSFWKFAASI